MKIISLEAENVKRLKAVAIKPDRSLVVIGGRNGAGKSSVLDSVAYALGGKAFCPAEPIRRGEDHAKVSVDLGEMMVERTFTRKGSYVRVLNKEGFEAKSPQAILDRLMGKLSFDPLAFAKMDTAKQAETLKALVGLDLTEFDTKAEEAFSERTLVNRDVKALEARLAAMPRYEDMPAEPLSVAKLMEKLEEAQAHNANMAFLTQEVENCTVALQRRQETINNISEQIENLRRELAEAEATRPKLTAALAQATKEANGFVRMDEDSIREKIAGAESINAKIRENEAREAVQGELEGKQEEAAVLTSTICEARAAKVTAVAKAKFPVEELGFDGHQVTFNGLPFDQASDAEKLRVSVAMAIAMNPKLRVMLIRDGSLLDEQNLAMIAKMAADADSQVWLERVGAGPEVSVLIEDGAVAQAKKGDKK